MQTERVPAAAVRPSDVIAFGTLVGWWSVDGVDAEPDRVRLELTSVDSEQSAEIELGDRELVRRAEPGVVHHRDEFLGLTEQQAQAWAAALGWTFRNRSASGFFTDDLRPGRINLWFGSDGLVCRAEFG